MVVVFELSMKMRWLGFHTFIRHKRTMVKVSSQNYRIIRVGRDFWRLSSPIPSKADSLHQVAQESVQVGFEYLQRRRLHKLFG